MDKDKLDIRDIWNFMYQNTLKPFVYIIIWYISMGIILISMCDFKLGFELFVFTAYAAMLGFNAYLQLLILLVVFLLLLSLLKSKLEKKKNLTNK